MKDIIVNLRFRLGPFSPHNLTSHTFRYYLLKRSGVKIPPFGQPFLFSVPKVHKQTKEKIEPKRCEEKDSTVNVYV